MNAEGWVALWQKNLKDFLMVKKYAKLIIPGK